MCRPTLGLGFGSGLGHRGHSAEAAECEEASDGGGRVQPVTVVPPDEGQSRARLRGGVSTAMLSFGCYCCYVIALRRSYIL